MTSHDATTSYVLITPARNEEENIERLVMSMVCQEQLPLRWVIVNDASTDRTEAIIKKYLDRYSWIELVNMPAKRDRSFAAKVQCFNDGYQRVKDLDYQVVGNLDADVSFDSDYLKLLMGKFSEDPDLGVAGTPFVEDDGYSSMKDSFEGTRHVPGGCQLFRKECYLEIGGYIPNKEGGVDWIAVTTARMKGWKTRSFSEKHFHHHRRIGTAEANKFRALLAHGRKDQFLGNHPLWEIFRICFRCGKKPYLIGGLLIGIGYLSGFISRTKRPISDELLGFHQEEQIKKLRAIMCSILKLRKIGRFDLQYLILNIIDSCVTDLI